MDFRIIVHYAALAYFSYIFGYAGLFKVIQKTSMMNSMQSLGFNRAWTLVIGYAEVLGVLGIVAGLFIPHLKNASVLYLWPFAIAAFATHMAHHEFSHYFNSLAVTVLPVLILCTDKQFRLSL